MTPDAKRVAAIRHAVDMQHMIDYKDIRWLLSELETAQARIAELESKT